MTKAWTETFPTDDVHFHYERTKSGSTYTFATLRNASRDYFLVGIARCDKSDNFNKKRGRAIALSRLMAVVSNPASENLAKYTTGIGATNDGKLPDTFRAEMLQYWRNMRLAVV